MREFRLEVAAPMMVTVLSPVEFQFCNLHFEPVTTKLLLQVQAWATLYPACPSISLQKKRTVEEWEKAARSTCALPLLSGLCQSSTQRALLIKSEGFLLKKKRALKTRRMSSATSEFLWCNVTQSGESRFAFQKHQDTAHETQTTPLSQ